MRKNILLAFITSALISTAGSLRAQDWTYTFEPYLQAASIEGDVGIGRATGVPVDVDFGEILEVLEFGLMAHFEGHHRSGWGFALDYVFIDLDDDLDGPFRGVTSARVEQTVFEALLVKRNRLGEGELDYIAGFRYWDNVATVIVDPAVDAGTRISRGSQSWGDLVLGVRWSMPLNYGWRWTLRADVGGFGLESDFTSTLLTGFQVALAKATVLNLQYKGTLVDYETGDPSSPGYFKYDTVTHGPTIGVVFEF